MKLKKLGTALVVVLALGAVMASSAFAAATTEVEPWRTGTSATTTTVLTGEPAVEAELVGTGVLETEVGTTPLKLESTELTCEGCKIKNESGGAKGTGKLIFKKVKVATPTTCKVTGPFAAEEVKTNPLKVDATYMGTIGGVASNTVLFEPVTAPNFATIELGKSGTASCPISGSYFISGSIYIKSINSTATYAQVQEVESSKAINEAGSGVTNNLKFNTKPAILTGKAKFKLSNGEFFGTE